MRFNSRNLFPYVAIVLILSAVAYAATFGRLERADFTFNNGTEVATLDPALAEGQPENRVLQATFDGLLSMQPIDQPPDKNFVIPLSAQPGAAESYTVSDDGLVYTFKIRPTAKWSDHTPENPSPVTAQDFHWSWRRTLHPDTQTKYGFQFYYIRGAKEYHQGVVEIGDQVQVELYDRPGVHFNPRGDAEPTPLNQSQPFPRGTIERGVLKEIIKPEPLNLDGGLDKDDKAKLEAKWKQKWVYLIDVRPVADGQVDWDSSGVVRAFAVMPSDEVNLQGTDFQGAVEKCHHVLPDWDSQVGVEVVDDHTLVVTLVNPTSYFDELVAFYPLFPVNRKCVETYGSPNWTKAENIVTNGPFQIKFRRLRDRIRLVKNPTYWNADNVELEVIDALTVNSETTDLNMFLNGQTDWGTTVPYLVTPDLLERNKVSVEKGERPDFLVGPALIVYFYRVNVTRAPFNDTEVVTWTEEGEEHQATKGVLVRRALNLALDKKEICEDVKGSGELPAEHFVPTGLTDYVSPRTGGYDAERARKLLELAGYAGGKGIPKIEILFNAQEAHRAIAEVIQQSWRTNLGIESELRQLEWSVFLSAVSNLKYSVARAGWVPDYIDANTFLDMWVTDGPQNDTGWSNAEYDKLIELAAQTSDIKKRAKVLQQAETILLDELPILPIYFYVTQNTVAPHVEGWHNNIQDVHPLDRIRIRKKNKRGEE